MRVYVYIYMYAHTHTISVIHALGESCIALCEDHAKAEDAVKCGLCSLSYNLRLKKQFNIEITSNTAQPDGSTHDRCM